MAGLGIGLAATGTSGITVAASFLGIFLGLLLMMPGYTLGATGAGDVKLMAAVGAIVGPALVLSAFLFTAIAGGVLAVIVAIEATAPRRHAGADRPAGGGARSRAAGDQAAPARAGSHTDPAIAVGSMLAVLSRVDWTQEKSK